MHGNLPALQAVLEDVRPLLPAMILVAGDLTGGPHNDEVIHLLRRHNALMILGNSDLNLLRYVRGEAPDGWYTHRQFDLLRWNATHIQADTLAYIEKLGQQKSVDWMGAGTIRMVHGSPRNPYESLYPSGTPPEDGIDEAASAAWALSQVEEDVLVCGHTHQPWAEYHGQRLALNPGAVCGPLNGSTGAQYARLHWHDGQWQVELCQVPYDLSQVRAAFTDSGLLEDGGPLARCFLGSIESGRDLALDFLGHARRLKRRAGMDDAGVIPDEIWFQAAADVNLL